MGCTLNKNKSTYNLDDSFIKKIKSANEYEICKRIFDSAQESKTNIVNIHEIHNTIIVMEKLKYTQRTALLIFIKSKKLENQFKNDMTIARNQLLSLGILHMDWKIIGHPNVGYSEKNKCFKIFDFDLSQIITLNKDRNKIETDKNIFTKFLNYYTVN